MDPTKAHNDPEVLREFAQQLAQFSDFVAEMDLKVASELAILADSCADPGFNDFQERFHQSRQKLHSFVNEARKAVPDLKKDAELLEIAQGIR
jgi:uncharacterized protein YukE